MIVEKIVHQEKGRRKMAKYNNMGRLMDFDLTEYGYDEYHVYCSYVYDKKVEGYNLTIYLKGQLSDDLYFIDTQHLNGDVDVIRNNVVRLVDYAARTKFFDRYIESYEYTYRCMEKGNEMYEEGNIA